MIEWDDRVLILSVKPHGETSALVQVLTRELGRHAGLVKGGQGRRTRPLLQVGNEVHAFWRARLQDHLGNFTMEAGEAHAARFLDDPDRLACLSSAARLCVDLLPEREPHPGCFDGLQALIEALAGDHWAEVYVQWEILLLRELGFGLDLTTCAATGDSQDLVYVSPRSGRAVSRAAGEGFKDRMLPLPGFLVGQGEGGEDEVLQGLRMTGYFFEKHLFFPRERELPFERQRLQQRLSRHAETELSTDPTSE